MEQQFREHRFTYIHLYTYMHVYTYTCVDIHTRVCVFILKDNLYIRTHPCKLFTPASDVQKLLLLSRGPEGTEEDGQAAAAAITLSTH